MHESDISRYMPTSLTVTMYDPAASIYGFTFNTVCKPQNPVIRIKREDSDQWIEYPFVSVEAETVSESVETVRYYISKAEVPLLKNMAYTYYICDVGAGVATEHTTITARDISQKHFSFAHLGDSQGGPEEFRKILSGICGKMDFLIHTGDVVQFTKYEHQWTEMLDGCYRYISTVPIMPISGNHEATIGKNAGRYETFKHFNNMIPDGLATELGYYYSFVYGNVKFIMLSTNDLDDNNRLTAAQYSWLINELEENNCRWTVVSMHNPMYSVGKYGVDPAKNGIAVALRDQLKEVYAKYGVDIVLQGHDHAISRTFPIDEFGTPNDETVELMDGVEYSVDPKGVIYLMNGPSGNQVREPVKIDGSLYKYAEGSKAGSWAELYFNGDMLTVEVKWYEGDIPCTYHKWGIKKTPIT